MRVTQNMMYSSMANSMNSTLAQYMELTVQGSTQKQVNSPSDDPAAYVEILNYRASISNTDQYIENSEDASSWLASTDAALTQAQVIIASIIEKAEQAATETYTDENLYQISMEIEELMAQLVTLANTEFNGQHLFSGHETSSSAYTLTLGVTTTNEEMEGVTFDCDGDLDRTAIIRFPEDGVIGGDEDLTYEYSKDGGTTWITKTLAAGDNVLDLDGAQVVVEMAWTGDPPTQQPTEVVGYSASGDALDPSNGTNLYVRTTAEYLGDDNNSPPEVDIYEAGNITSAVASGTFASNVQIRFDEDAQVGTDGEFTFSYSTDSGLTWTTATGATSESSDTVRLVLPTGYVDVEVGGDGTLTEGQELVVRPNRASDLGYEIANGTYMDVTSCGVDIFGGIYQSDSDEFAVPTDGVNIFESISDLIAYAQTGNNDGCAEALEELREGSEHLLTSLAEVGAKENRLTLNITILEMQSDDMTSRMSAIEDIDITMLMIDLTKAQVAYQTVLSASSNIMNISLINYL